MDYNILQWTSILMKLPLVKYIYIIFKIVFLWLSFQKNFLCFIFFFYKCTVYHPAKYRGFPGSCSLSVLLFPIPVFEILTFQDLVNSIRPIYLLVKEKT